MTRLGRLVPTSLTARLTATVVLLVALVGILVSGLTTAVLGRHLDRQLDDDLAAAHARDVRALTHRLGPDEYIGPGVPPQVGDARAQGAGTLTAYYASYGSTGIVLTGRGDEQALSEDELAEIDAEVPDTERPTSHDIEGLGDYRFTTSVVAGITVVTGVPTRDVRETVTEVAAWGAAFTLLAVGVAGAFAVVVVRRQLRPLREVARTAHEVAGLPLESGEVGMTARVPATLTDERTEVGQVGSALNVLLGHMESSLDARHRSEQQVRQFVADASHELRTPLATIQGYAELGLRPDADPERVLHVLGKVQGESRRMTSLVEDLLLLARLDAGRPLAREDVDLTHLVLEAVGDARVVAPDHRWKLDLADEAVVVPGDAQRLHQVLANLLANARRHTPAGTTVTVAAWRSADGATVTVHDDGPGVPVELQPSLFERFTRGDASRTRDSGGAGLGLSLAHAIATAHSGTLSCDSRPGSTTFTLTLPA
ncbi:sensor histidine kinase [Nocardioides jiangxiensis]|uniref:histidine kinase n=1 Tax=Nocardioides jiangxiensis TaxID=3064524 RepID=A0ABT9B1X5_9ACTN|nr:HAMP domain-containing sensor histidine kinase [Nocardioides sp. WY-20]MDO7868839.1 HAMP domain-containing sensor histidine kinase [Nocardioides sp. WY-20]